VFYRERAAGLYSVIPYAAAQFAIEMPYIALQCIGYRWSRLHPDVSLVGWLSCCTLSTAGLQVCNEFEGYHAAAPLMSQLFSCCSAVTYSMIQFDWSGGGKKFGW
jgi:hypothetical protein